MPFANGEWLGTCLSWNLNKTHTVFNLTSEALYLHIFAKDKTYKQEKKRINKNDAWNIATVHFEDSGVFVTDRDNV